MRKMGIATSGGAALKAVGLGLAGLPLLFSITVNECGGDDDTPTPTPIPTPTPTPTPPPPTPTPTPPPAATGGRIHGFAFADLGDEEADPFLLPDLTVILTNVGTGAEVRTVTDVQGRYRFRTQAPGTYRICWEAESYVPDCLDQTIDVESSIRYAEPILAVPDTTTSLSARSASAGLVPTPGELGVAAGYVTLSGESPCYVDQPYFGIQQEAEVSIVDPLTGLTLAGPVRASSSGGYVLPGIPIVTGLLNLVATCGADSGSLTIDVGDLLDLGSTVLNLLNITVDNALPKVLSLAAYSGGKAVRRVAPGSTVEVQAEVTDPDNDSMTYTFRAPTGTISGTSGSRTNWTLPNRVGVETIYVMASDKHGGYAMGELTLRLSSSTNTAFSGKVVAEDGSSIDGARIKVNGVQALASLGVFSLTVPEATSYVVQVEADGYVPVTETLDAGISEVTWTLRAATQLLFSASSGISTTLRDGGSTGAGITLTISPNTVVGSNGVPPSGNVLLRLSASDPDRRAIPDGYTAALSTGGDGFILPVAAASVELTDPTGAVSYNIATGKTARVTFLPSSAMLSSGQALASSLPLWYFDATNGKWKQEGTATLSGQTYVYNAPHFSRIATGKSADPSSCLRVRVDGSISLPARVQVSIPTSSTTEQIAEYRLKDQVNALTQLPPWTLISVVPLDAKGVPIETARQTIDSGDPLAAGVTNPSYPYGECGGDVLLSLLPTPLGFEHGYTFLWAEGKPTSGQEVQEVKAYYSAIDPTNTRTTLGNWWKQNGFDSQTGAGGNRATFLNKSELAYWRDMHCIERSNGDAACFVGKYLDGGAAVAGDTSWTVETVTMEYREVVAGRGKTVTFATYQGATADAPRVESADFDGLGERYVPWVCLNCHGGTYDPRDGLHPTTDEVYMGSSFLMFDVGSFGYSSLWPRADQEAVLKQLNELVARTKPHKAIADLIEGWYASGSNTPNEAWAPSTFTGSPQNTLYSEIISKSCRTCHVAQEGLEWDTYFDQNPDTDGDVASARVRKLIRMLVCGEHHMPHARPTFARFWTSEDPHQPTVLAEYQDPSVGWSAFGACD